MNASRPARSSAARPTTLTIQAPLTVERKRALAALSAKAEERGGNPKRSVDRHPNGPKTRRVIVISKLDGSVITAVEERAFRTAIGGAS